MNKKTIIAGAIVFSILAFFFLCYIYEWDTPITGFIIKNIDSKNGLISRHIEGDSTVEVYLTNLGVDKIKLSEGSKDADAIFLLASIYMKNNRINLRDYEILNSVRDKGLNKLQEFKAFYDEKDKYWTIKYYEKTGFLKTSICTVKIKNDGELKDIKCK